MHENIYFFYGEELKSAWNWGTTENKFKFGKLKAKVTQI